MGTASLGGLVAPADILWQVVQGCASDDRIEGHVRDPVIGTTRVDLIRDVARPPCRCTREEAPTV